MEGLALALGRPLVATPENVAWMEERTRMGHKLGYFETEAPNAGLLKMARLPDGAEAMPNEIGTALGAIVTAGPKPTTLFTLPGVPHEFYRMFDQSVRPRLAASAPILTEELVLYTEESRFFGVLATLEKEYPQVAIGSYPERGCIRIRATSSDPAAARKVLDRMREAGRPYLERRTRQRGDGDD